MLNSRSHQPQLAWPVAKDDGSPAHLENHGIPIPGTGNWFLTGGPTHINGLHADQGCDTSAALLLFHVGFFLNRREAGIEGEGEPAACLSLQYRNGWTSGLTQE